MDIVTLTMNPAIDVSVSVDRVIADAKLRCGVPRHEPGGGGVNVSRAIQRLGGKSLAIYPAGGATGEFYEKLLSDEGLSQHRITVSGWTRENLMVTEESTGRQYRFIMPGPELSERQWQKCLDELSGLNPRPKYIVASGSLPQGAPEGFYAQVVRLGKKLGSRVVVDTKGDALIRAAEEGVYLLKPNLGEFTQLTGRAIDDEAEMRKAAAELVRQGMCQALALSLGRAGAWLFTREESTYIPTPTVTIRSTVGSGDSMVGGIVLSLVRGKSLEEAVRFGVAAGAAAVMTPGTELCRREDAERLYEQIQSGQPAN